MVICRRGRSAFKRSRHGDSVASRRLSRPRPWIPAPARPLDPSLACQLIYRPRPNLSRRRSLDTRPPTSRSRSGHRCPGAESVLPLAGHTGRRLVGLGRERGCSGVGPPGRESAGRDSCPLVSRHQRPREGRAPGNPRLHRVRGFLTPGRPAVIPSRACAGRRRPAHATLARGYRALIRGGPAWPGLP
jgi:hypothetical protein